MGALKDAYAPGFCSAGLGAYRLTDAEMRRLDTAAKEVVEAQKEMPHRPGMEPRSGGALLQRMRGAIAAELAVRRMLDVATDGMLDDWSRSPDIGRRTEVRFSSWEAPEGLPIYGRDLPDRRGAGGKPRDTLWVYVGTNAAPVLRVFGWFLHQDALQAARNPRSRIRVENNPKRFRGQPSVTVPLWALRSMTSFPKDF